MKEKRRKIRIILGKKEVKLLLKTLRVLCGSMRFSILMTLKYLGQEGLAVADLAVILSASPSRISHQLKILRDYKLVKITRKNREVLYFLTDHRAERYFSGIGI